MPPRGWQPPAREAILAHEGPKGALVVVATGCGKTYLGNWVAVEDYALKGRRVVWVSHRKALVDQPGECVREHFPHAAHLVGVVRADRDQSEKPLVYASIQTLWGKDGKRLEHLLSFGQPDLLIVDEAHRSLSKQYQRVIDALTGPNTKVVGLTATADREDGADIEAKYEIVYSYGIARAIKDGVLLPPYAAKWKLAGLDVTKIGGRKDFIAEEAGKAMVQAGAVEAVVAAFKAESHVATRLPFRDDSKAMAVGDRSTLVFTASVNQAILTAKALEDEGVVARYVHGGMTDTEVDRILGLFRQGKIQVLVNAMVLTEGTDLPRASCIIIARPTKSWSLYVQMVGRVLRIFGEQGDALVIDLAGGVTEMHSLIAAPVLITTGCLESPDKLHRYFIPDNTNKGFCVHCEHEVPCGKRGGKHKFENGECVTCGQVQCPESDDGMHIWIDWSDNQNACAECGLKIPRNDGAIRPKKKERVKGAWKKLNCPGDVHACAAGQHGFVYRVAADGQDLWLPVWSPRGNRPRRLSQDPVTREEAELLLSDILRKVEKASEMYGKKDSERAYVLSYTQAEKIARTWSLWRNVA